MQAIGCIGGIQDDNGVCLIPPFGTGGAWGWIVWGFTAILVLTVVLKIVGWFYGRILLYRFNHQPPKPPVPPTPGGARRGVEYAEQKLERARQDEREELAKYRSAQKAAKDWEACRKNLFDHECGLIEATHPGDRERYEKNPRAYGEKTEDWGDYGRHFHLEAYPIGSLLWQDAKSRYDQDVEAYRQSPGSLYQRQVRYVLAQRDTRLARQELSKAQDELQKVVGEAINRSRTIVWDK